jgi:D-3-phosphoglycerate dehydrogenase
MFLRGCSSVPAVFLLSMGTIVHNRRKLGRREKKLQAVFVDADDTLAAIAEKLRRKDDPPVAINRDPEVTSDALPALLGDAEIAIIDHTQLPTRIAASCRRLKHVVFLGTGARSYMSPEELAQHGIAVHTIKGYGDTAVAECAIALMWASARGFARMDRAMRAGQWLGIDGVQLTGKTLGLVGFGGIAAEVARIALGSGMRVIAWNRSPRSCPGVAFVPLEQLLAGSDVISLHLLLTDDTRGFLSRQRIAAMKPGAILVNTARGGLIDEEAMIEALRSGHIRHAGLDVFATEPLPADHVLTRLENVTLSAHAAFRTPESSENLIGAALDHCRRIAAGGR